VEDDCDDIERKLQGRTLQVYWYLRKKKEPSSGIREIQRDLGLSSPSVAEYQIEKLAEMGIVSRDSYGRVVLARKVKVKAMESHVSMGRFSVPRLAFYAAIFSAVAVLYGIFDGSSIYGIAVPAAAAAVLWVEARRVWKFSTIASSSSKKEKEKESILPLLVPAMAALAVFVAGAVFIFHYAPEPSFVQVQARPPIQPLQSRPTIEESVEMSRQKVAASPGEQGAGPDLLISMSLGGSAVTAFLAYILVRYRSSSSGVLVQVQREIAACGTQDYPERPR
jgi:SOS-response transcriptional repressor LexA